MKSCSFLENNTNWSLDPQIGEQSVFDHIQNCPNCHTIINKWNAIDQAIVSLETDNPVLEESHSLAKQHSAHLLVQRAQQLRDRPTLFGIRRNIALISLGLAQTTAVVVIALVLYANRDNTKGDQKTNNYYSVITDDLITSKPFDPNVSVVAAPSNSRITVQLGRDLIGLEEESSLRFDLFKEDETQVSLLGGTACFAAGRRNNHERLTVKAGKTTVKVLGTRFRVTRFSDETIEVATAEGKVGVENNGRSWTIEKQQRLKIKANGATEFSSLDEEDIRHIDAALSLQVGVYTNKKQAIANNDNLGAIVNTDPIDSDDENLEIIAPSKTLPKTKTTLKDDDELNKLQNLVRNGQIEEAEAALKLYLQKKPKEAAAWSLLADCNRKAAKWSDAVKALSKVEATGSFEDAQRARFRAGVILQDKLNLHEEACRKFDMYLTDSKGTVKAEAMLRLAISKNACGKKAEANFILNNIVKEHRGTVAAEKAQKMLLTL